MSVKKRRYNDSYIEYGFTCIINNGEERPQCVICNKVLSNDFLKPTKLKQHLHNVHQQHKDKSRGFFERHATVLKKMRLDSNGTYHEANKNAIEASYHVALEIAKQKKPHTIGENLIKPCSLKIVELMLGKEEKKKIAAVSLSNSTIQRRIEDMAADIKDQVVQEIKSAAFGLFSIQLDESTDVDSCSQLMAFVRYVHLNGFKEELLFCSRLEKTTKAVDIFEKVSSFFESENLLWENVCGCCTDGAPAMLGTKSGFQAFVKKQNPNAKGIHCMIHRHALASKTLPPPLREVLDQTIQMVNFVKGGALNSRLFKQLCIDMDADHHVLLFHTKTRWLSRGNVTKRVFELRNELKIFFELEKKMEFVSLLNNDRWIRYLAYMVDIFDQLNKLNLKMQKRNTNIIQFKDSLKAFISKLDNWKRKVRMNNVAMFEELSSALKVDEEEHVLPDLEKELILQHLVELESEFIRYFPDIDDDELALIRNPFILPVEKVPDDFQDEFLELKADSCARDLFNEKSITEFWPLMCSSYPKVAKKAIQDILPFVSTYLCESGFSTLLQMKTKQRNRLDVENDMRCALSTTFPRIHELSKKKQSQVSH